MGIEIHLELELLKFYTPFFWPTPGHMHQLEGTSISLYLVVISDSKAQNGVRTRPG